MLTESWRWSRTWSSVIVMSDPGIAARLIKDGVNVLVTQQTSLREIEDTMLLLGRIVGKETRARTLVHRLPRTT